MGGLYQVYQDCLSVWLLDAYHELHRNRNFGSLKLLLKLRDTRFLRHFNHLVLTCRGDVEDPLLEFLLYLTDLVNPDENAVVTLSKHVTHFSSYNKLSERESFRDSLDTLESQLITPRSVVNPVDTSKFEVNKNVKEKMERAQAQIQHSEEDLVDGYVVFLSVFLASLVPILLYTYLQRVKGGKHNEMAVIDDYCNYLRASKLNDDHLEHGGWSLRARRPRGRRTVVVRSLRTLTQRRLLSTQRFRAVLNSVQKGEAVDELNAYASLFAHLGSLDRTSKLTCDRLDNVSGLQLLLYKISLLNLGKAKQSYAFREIPQSIYDIYTRLEDGVLKSQLESSLIYCYRLRINDLNLKVNVNKLFKNLIKFSKYSSRVRSKKYYNPKPNVYTFTATNDLLSKDFSDRDILNIVTNCLVFLGTNLVYLNKLLNDAAPSGLDTGTRYRNGFADKYIYYAYKISKIVCNPGSYTRLRRTSSIAASSLFTSMYDGELCRPASPCEAVNNMEYLYNILMFLFKHLFQFTNTVEDGDVLNYSYNYVRDHMKTDSWDFEEPVTKNELGVTNKYDVFNTCKGGKRVYITDNLCLLVFKINFDFYRLVFSNLATVKELYQTLCWEDKGDKSGLDSDLYRTYFYTLYTYFNNINVFKLIKRRISYELFPQSYWLITSHLKLLQHQLYSQCQSKPP